MSVCLVPMKDGIEAYPMSNRAWWYVVELTDPDVLPFEERNGLDVSLNGGYPVNALEAQLLAESARTADAGADGWLVEVSEWLDASGGFYVG